MLRNLLIIAYIALGLAAGLILGVGPSVAQEEVARGPDEILAEAGGTPTPAAINELFINCSEWDEKHSEVQNASRDALIDMGATAVPTLLESWLGSVDVRRRVELDSIITAIGHPSAQYLIPYMESQDDYTRRHAAYLLGDTAAILALDDPLALGPVADDGPALEALVSALAAETDWHAIASMLGSIGKMRDPSRIDSLVSFLGNEEEAVRLAAVIALGRIPTQQVVPHLIGAFSDGVMSVRQAAVLALSTATMGNLAFEALVGRAILPATGTRIRLCSLEALARYLEVIGSDESGRAVEQRQRAYDAAVTVMGVAAGAEMWRSRGLAAALMGFTYQTDAQVFLERLAGTEKHPFVLGKISEALDRLAEGPPEPVEEAG